jgi:hypothetical protein
MAVYQAPNVTTYGYQPPGTGHGEAQITQHLYAKAFCGAALAANDTIQFGYIPNNAVVDGVILKADAQLDTGGSPTLAFDLGVTGTAQLFKAAVTTVGHAGGASADATNTGAGTLYKNTTGAKQLVYATVHTAAETAAASGTIELSLSYWLQDTVGSQA